MLKTIFKIFFLLILIPNFSFSQTKEAEDSLLNILKKNELTNIQKFDILFELSTFNQDSNIEKSLDYLNKANSIAREFTNEFQQTKILISYANIYNNNKEFNKSIIYFNKAKLKALKLKDSSLLSDVYYNKARLYYNLNKVDSSIILHNLALQLRKTLKDNHRLAESYNALGLMNWRTGDLKDAEYFYQNSIEFRKKNNDKLGISIVLNNLGILNFDYGNYNKALDYFLKAIEYAKKISDQKRILLINNNIGLIYQKWDNLKLALKYHKEAAFISKKINYQYGIAYSNINIANCYSLSNNEIKAINLLQKVLKDKSLAKRTHIMLLIQISNSYTRIKSYKEAHIHLNKALNEADKINSVYYKSQIYTKLAKVMYNLTKIDSSLILAKKSYTIASENNYKEILAETNLILYLIYQQKEQYKTSIHHYKMMSKINDSIFNIEKSKEIAELNAKKTYSDQKLILKLQQVELERQVTELNKKKRNQFILWVSIIFFIAIISFIIIISMKVFSLKNKIQIQSLKLIDTNKKLSSLNKFKENLVNMIIDDLQNPLTEIYDNNKLEILKPPLNKINSLISNILDIKKIEESRLIVKLEKKNLGVIIENSINDIEYLLHKKNITIKNQISNNKIIIETDPTLLERVIINLLHNATKYSPINSEIIIETKNYKDNTFTLIISDKGRGIPEHEIDKIFEKFYQVKKSYHATATGLGLSFCKLATHAMNQAIGAYNNEFGGSSFWITFTKLSETKLFLNKISKKTNKINFDINSMTKIAKYCSKFETVEVFEFSKVYRITTEIKKNTEKEFIVWANRIEQSCFESNSKKYRELTNFENFKI